MTSSGTDDDVLFVTGAGCTAAIAKLAHLLGLTQQARSSAGVARGGAKRHACSYVGCNRTFDDTPSLLLHSRTHPDGERSAMIGNTLGGGGGGGGAVASSGATDLSGASSGDDANDAEQYGSTVVFVGPMEHHSNLLVWREAAVKVGVGLGLGLDLISTVFDAGSALCRACNAACCDSSVRPCSSDADR